MPFYLENISHKISVHTSGYWNNWGEGEGILPIYLIKVRWTERLEFNKYPSSEWDSVQEFLCGKPTENWRFPTTVCNPHFTVTCDLPQTLERGENEVTGARRHEDQCV